MESKKNSTGIFSKGRRGADALKITYIICAIILAATVFVASLPLWLIALSMIVTYPLWNIIDGMVDDGEQLKAITTNTWDENKLHALFNWFALGFLSIFSLTLCIIAASSQLTAFTAGTAVVGGLPLAIFLGPIGCTAFAITMLWLAKKSYMNWQDPEQNTNVNHHRIDFFAWLTAGLGSAGFSVIAFLALASIAFPPAIPIVCAVVVLISASIKLYQLASTSEPKVTPDNIDESTQAYRLPSDALGDKTSLEQTGNEGLSKAQSLKDHINQINPKKLK